MASSPAATGPERPRRSAPATGALLVLAALLTLAGTACGSSGDGARGPATSTTAKAATTTTTTVVDQLALEDRTFWYGDDAGSLFEAELTGATATDAPDGGRVVVTGTARNLLGAAAAFTSDATLTVAGDEYDLEVEEDDPIDPGASGPIQLIGADVPADLDLAKATVTFGAPGTNQSIIPLASDEPVTSEAPVVGLAVAAGEGALVGGATVTPTTSVLYPRYGSDRTDQRRLELGFDLAIPEGGEAKGLYLHPSLTDPAGVDQSIGDQNAFPPGGPLLEHAILTGGTSGPARVTFLEVLTNTAQIFTVTIP